MAALGIVSVGVVGGDDDSDYDQDDDSGESRASRGQLSLPQRTPVVLHWELSAEDTPASEAEQAQGGRMVSSGMMLNYVFFLLLEKDSDWMSFFTLSLLPVLQRQVCLG